ncbi:ABC transporter, transmembrane domain, type 1 [Metarhizium album ARSEF 1941]|uniref:ABC transporter, transmembrane domain, type 1 n=1 Tax=Metarhizium album (strain ARSEF 1941) TaxID=1081103 RepID=A0A0B2WZS9_METAS|nr:ABC transporter, transmembrane domain, type 1 [Metarhizium album ARSEF 1941]KHN98942.1 ABC transporter, transmembrane domain, type 1 [Metarhizium album ARSEF 1941]
MCSWTRHVKIDAAVPSETLYAFASILLWGAISLLLVEGETPHWPAYIIAWTAGGISDLILVAISASEFSASGAWASTLVGLQAVRVVIFFLAAIYCYSFLNKDVKTEKTNDVETRSLLGAVDDDDSSVSSTAYGSVHANHDHDGIDVDEASDDEDDKEIKMLQKKRLEQAGGWLGYLTTLLVFLPIILPYKHRPTQMWIVALGICIVLQRILTLMIPRQYGILTEAIGNMSGTGQVPWRELITWGLLNFPIEATLSLVHSRAGERVSQFAYRQLTTLAFSHVMNLSMDYHTSKSTGRVAKAIEQGSNLSYMLNSFYDTFPIFVDFFIAIVYLSAEFDATMGFIIVATSMIHVYVAYKGNSRTVQIERQVNETNRAENENLYDSITNWQTVAYHNRQKYEEDRYANSVWKAVWAQRTLLNTLDVVSFLESFVMEAGLLAAVSLVAVRIANGTAKFSSFVFLVSYWDTIRSPMSMLAWNIREATTHVIDAEWLYQLIQTKPSVRDKEGADKIQLKGGKVEFKNVSFSYGPDRPIIRGMTFTAEPGQSVALVGETGSGKSTTLKLLYRFYDVSEGSIAIDGQDIRDVTLGSLRDVLGAVPQDPAVFDQTLMENILYARPGATEADAIEACKAARIHHQIMKFPEGYQTRLGERGARLSGGELQRLAIARVILRQPRIVVLDEATSAVDSETESLIQQAIAALSAGRTVFMIAHRLSTVVNADLILVIDQGQVVERGSHRELLRLGGKYARLWNMQTIVRDEIE